MSPICFERAQPLLGFGTSLSQVLKDIMSADRVRQEG